MRKILKILLAVAVVFGALTVTVCAQGTNEVEEYTLIDDEYEAPKPAVTTAKADEAVTTKHETAPVKKETTQTNKPAEKIPKVTTAPEKEADASKNQLVFEESITSDESTGVWSTDPSEMDGYLSDETFGNLFGSLMSEDLFNQALETGEPLEEEGNAYTRDLLYDKDCHKQFITVQTRAGNTFYIVIDYDAPINEKEEQYQVYFLNMVDDEDLLSLLDEVPSEEIPECSCKEKCVLGKVNAECDVCKNDLTGCKGIEPEPPKEEEPEPEAPPIESEPEAPAKKNGILPMLGVIAVIAVGGLAFYYIKFVKGRKTDDMDFYDDEGYEEEYVNEDEESYNETEDGEEDKDELTDEDEQQ